MFSVGTAGVDLLLIALGVGRPEEVTARMSGLPGVGGNDGEESGFDSFASGMSGRGFRVFDTGKAGSGADGGASGDVEGRRMPVEVMVAVADMLQWPVTLPSPSTPSCTRLFARSSTCAP